MECRDGAVMQFFIGFGIYKGRGGKLIIESFVAFMNKIMFFSSYVDNVSSFPKTLSATEEKEWLEKLKQGDKEAKSVLVSHNRRLVAHIVKKYSNSAKEADDLISVGAIGLIKAIDSYSPEKNTQLSTYAARCIENEILMLFRANKKHQNNLSLEESVGVEKDGNEIMLGDMICDSEHDVEEEVSTLILNERLRRILAEKLSEREYKILCMRYGIGGGKELTQREVAIQMGISRSYISRLEKKALSSLKGEVEAQLL